jgi:hypothetical protein
LLRPNDETKEELEKVEKEIAWIKNRIEEGKDPGCHVE